jgi:uncharacterized protein (TIGR03000 family)
MRRKLFSAGVVPLLAAAVCLTAAGPTHAQLLSTWGHPVFTLGWTPYEAMSAGHGYYIGSDGFIPGYGYYPGQGPSHYPWYDVPAGRGHGGPAYDFHPAPGTPSFPTHANATPAPKSVGTETLPATAAVLTVRVPESAAVWFDEVKTSQTGAARRFVTPELPAGSAYSYAVHARWTENGLPVHRTRVVDVRPGDRLTVDFLAPEAARRTPAE